MVVGGLWERKLSNGSERSSRGAESQISTPREAGSPIINTEPGLDFFVSLF